MPEMARFLFSELAMLQLKDAEPLLIVPAQPRVSVRVSGRNAVSFRESFSVAK